MIIGLTTAHDKNTTSERLNIEYISSVKQAGGLPVLIPPLDENMIDELLMTVQGIILTGGGDIDPVLYGDSERVPETVEVSTERDRFEIALARKAHALDMPTLGICRGMQILNVAFGGSLYQDIVGDNCSETLHDQGKPYDALTHTVQIIPGTRLAELSQENHRHPNTLEAFPVNSIHHQTIKELGEPFQINALSEDGLIEGIEDPSKSFYIGVQWHPEYLASGSLLFDAFCTAVMDAPCKGDSAQCTGAS